MLEALLWLLIIEIFGLLALPLAWRVFRNLPDRGYAFAKPLGLLLTSYLFWLLGSFGLLRNEAVSIVFVMVLVAVISARIVARHKDHILTFLSEKWRHILTVELIFVVAFGLWVWFRAYNPQLDSTERPMDLAFLNAILRSDRFPPNDPWLSGFAISYYYFGYLMMAVVTKLTGISGAIAFNLAVPLLFAWTISGAFTLVYNLVQHVTSHGESQDAGEATLYGLLGALMVAVIGNLQILFDMLHARGLGSDAFWAWLDLKKIADAPVTGKWFPTDPPDSWWWWRASRVIHDRDLLGRTTEVIDEFPFFSFLLGDMHPHVLALPFVLLALGLALSVFLGFRPRREIRDIEEEQEESEEAQAEPGFVVRLWQRAWNILRLNAFDIGIWAVCLGGLAFLNTWDFPIYLFIFLAALALRRYRDEGWFDGWEIAIYAGWIFGLGVLAYFPFYVGFRSQAGGILPVLYNVTRLPQYLIMFGLFIFCLVSSLIMQWRNLGQIKVDEDAYWLRTKETLGAFAQVALFIILLPLLGASLAVFLVTTTEKGQAYLQDLMRLPEVQAAVGGQTIGDLLRRFALMRLRDPWMVLLLVGMVAGFVTLIWSRSQLAQRIRKDELDLGPQVGPLNWSAIFAGLLAVVGLLLTLVTEFVFLRDFFGTRMNTIFKFWYQAWVQMAIASTFGVWYILRGRRRVGHYVWLGVFFLIFGISMVYPVASMYSKAGQFQREPTLNGVAYMQRYRPGDYAAIQWLQENVEGDPVILEAPGGSYSQYGRVSAQTGLPTVLGWDFHEQQWRGTYEEPAKRQPDIEKIYKSLDRETVSQLLAKYDIAYVYIGDLERTKYKLQPPMIQKFGRMMELVYEQDGVQIYRRGQ
jgi:YYY domain-containing protein